MGNTLVKIERTQRNVSKLHQLQLAVEQADLEHFIAKINTTAAWVMFDQAVEDGDKEKKNDLAELAAFCESVQHDAYVRLGKLQAQLLALMS